MGAITEIRTESAYDAMQEGMPFVVRLVSEPATFEELHAIEPELPRAQVEQRLKRLVRNGLIREEGNRFEAVAQVVRQVRQEGIITSLSRYILPTLTDIVSEPGKGFVQQLDLHLPVPDQVALRQGVIHDLAMGLKDLSDEPAAKTKPCIAVIVGTSDVPGPMDPGERLLETVLRSARQRAIPSQADRAVLTQIDGYFGTAAILQAESLFRQLAERLASEQPTGVRANYTLALAFSARERTEKKS